MGLEKKPKAWLLPLLGALSLCGCCDESDKQLSLIPWGEGNTFGPSIEVEDSLTFSAEVTGHARGFVLFGDRCVLYASRDRPGRFDFRLSDTTVARISRGIERNYVVGKQPGITTLTVSSSGLPSIDLVISVVARAPGR